MYYTMDQIKRANRNAGHHWFEPDTMRFFSSRVDDFTACGPGGVFFVSSEQFNARSPRLYTVRRFDPSTGGIDTVGDFQGYRSGSGARKAAERFARDGVTA